MLTDYSKCHVVAPSTTYEPTSSNSASWCAGIMISGSAEGAGEIFLENGGSFRLEGFNATNDREARIIPVQADKITTGAGTFIVIFGR